MRACLTTVLAGLAIIGIAAEQPLFKSTAEFVRIPVNVTRSNRPVDPGVLTAADFKLTEDGEPQTVALFQRESLPLSIVVVYDISGSMGEQRSAEFGVYALRQVSMRLRPEDEISLITFAGKPVVTVPWTPAPEAVKLSLDLKAKGSTSLLDAVLYAFSLLDTASNPRPVVLLVSDGFENSSTASWKQVVTSRRQSEAAVYAFTIAPLLRTQPHMASGNSPFDVASPTDPVRQQVALAPSGVNMIPGLVGNSGGVEYRVATGLEVPMLAQALIDDLRFQYTIGYTPSKAFDGKYRRVTVELKKRGYRVRHRGGYLALPASK